MPATGNLVYLPGENYQEALLPFTSVTSGTVFYSVALNLTAAPTGASYTLGLATGNTNYAAVIFVRASGGGYELGIANRSNGTPTYHSTVYSLNSTVFLVASYEFVTGTGNDVSSLWINPAPATFGETAIPTATVTHTGGTDMTAISQFLVRGAAGSPVGLLDELRVGTTWASVTPPEPTVIPEPSAYAAVLGLGALVGLVLRRRYRSA